MTGLQRADERLSTAALDTAAASVPVDRVSISSGDDLISAQSDRMQAEVSYRANIKTIQTAQQMDETLLQLFAR